MSSRPQRPAASVCKAVAACAAACGLVGTVPAAPALAGAAAAERWQADRPALQWQWDAQSLQGPAGLRCAAPRQQLLRLDAPELADVLGVAPHQAAARLRGLGVMRLPVPTQRIRCEGVALDLLHTGEGQALLLAPGHAQAVRRVAIDPDPLATVQQLLLAHAASPMGFSAPRVRPLARWLSPSLWAAVHRHLARPRARDAVPAVPFDAFTGADEIPSRITLEPAEASAGTATVVMHAVLDGIGRDDHRITYVLRRHQAQWRVDDVRYLDGGITLRTLLMR